MARMTKMATLCRPLGVVAGMSLAMHGLALMEANALPAATGSNAPNKNYTPGTDPCTNSNLDSEAANAFQSAFNKGIQNSNPSPKSRSSTATIKLGDPFGWQVWPRESYTAAASETPTITGTNTGIATVTANTTDCSYSAGSFTSTGTLTTVLKWPSVEVKVTSTLDGFFVDYFEGTSVDVKVSNLMLSLPGTYTIKSNSDKTAQVTAFKLSNCSSSGNVSASVSGLPAAAISAKDSTSNPSEYVQQNVQSDVNDMGSQMCIHIQSKLNDQLPYTFSLTGS